MKTKHLRSIMWQPVDKTGMEVCYFGVAEDSDGWNRKSGYQIDGHIVGVSENKAFEIRYGLFGASQDNFHWVYFDYQIDDGKNYTSEPFHTDGDGSWYDHYQRPASKFDGCLMAYISQSPSGITFILNQLKLAEGQTAEIKLMAIDALEIRFTPELHRYTCVERGESGGTYKCENLTNGIETSFSVDADNLVIDYHNQFRRVWSNTETA